MPSDIQYVTAADPGYPKLLGKIPDPPTGLHRLGDYAFEHTCVAIVGTRRATPYGRAIATRLAADLARLGFCVVSGLALGIDTAAHEGALSAGGKTVAVLGCGVDVIYPPQNARLYHRIAESGAILSEFPLGQAPTYWSFAARNRIVAGCSVATVVVESDTDGGAMITARLAGEQGRSVFAVPGRLDQRTSAGCHQLIRDGATLFTRVEDILADLSYLGGLLPQPIAARTAPPAVAIGPDERLILDRFAGGEALALDALAEIASLRPSQLAAILTLLELKGLIVKRPDARYEAT